MADKGAPAIRAPIVALRQRRPHAQHAGLLLQRYLACAATGDNANHEERRELFRAAMDATSGDALQKLYAAAYDRWNASFNDGGVHIDLELGTTLHGRLIVGLGSENVLETGIRLHHTYGLPFLPGSALKGIAAHYCHEVWGQSSAPSADETQRAFRRDGAYYNLLFGTTDDSGVIAFHDAWLTPASLKSKPLRLDVMTPHHQNFQRGPEDQKFRAPTDFDSPIPVSFLSVSGTFRVRLSWRGPADAPTELARDWTALAATLVAAALGEWGIGGKTSSGYGRLAAASPVAQTTSQPLHYAATPTKNAPTTPSAPPSDWEQLEAVYVKRLGQDHLVQLPDGTKVRAVCRTVPNSLPRSGDRCRVYRQRSGSRECRWEPPPAR